MHGWALSIMLLIDVFLLFVSCTYVLMLFLTSVDIYNYFN